MITLYGLNVQKFNGARSAGFFARVREEQPDIICLQETKRNAADFPAYAKIDRYEIVASFDPTVAHDTGVAIISKHPIENHDDRLCAHQTCRGRFIEATIGGLQVSSVYAHAHNSKDGARWPLRQQFYECLGAYMQRNAAHPCIVVTDANVALTRPDVAKDTQWSGPWANGGKGKYRTPIVEAMKAAGWVDSYRVVHGDRRRATVWYSAAAFAGHNGVDEGFGIDFQLVSAPLAARVLEAEVFKPRSWEERFSDHALTWGRYDISLT